MALNVVLVVAIAAVASVAGAKLDKCLRPCKSVGGTFTIDLANVYPESGDFDSLRCQAYISSTGNNTLVRYDPSTKQSTAKTLDGISFNDEYLLSGVEYHRASDSLYVSANARRAFYTNGADLSGPNHLLKITPGTHEILWELDLAPTIALVEDQVGSPVGGFQDQAVDKYGNAYYMGTWGNILLKVSPEGSPSVFYVPPSNIQNTLVPGFGALTTFEDRLLVADALSASLVVFDLKKPDRSPVKVQPTNLPQDYSPFLCDSLIVPKMYSGKVLLCADILVQGVGAIVVYRSESAWSTAEYVGMILNEFTESSNGTTTATFEAGKSIYAVLGYTTDANGETKTTDTFPIVDITERIDALL